MSPHPLNIIGTAPELHCRGLNGLTYITESQDIKRKVRGLLASCRWDQIGFLVQPLKHAVVERGFTQAWFSPHSKLENNTRVSLRTKGLAK